MIVRDKKDEPAAVEIEKDKVLRRGDTLELTLPPGGGYIARFTLP
jgi:hypothetical protein